MATTYPAPQPSPAQWRKYFRTVNLQERKRRNPDLQNRMAEALMGQAFDTSPAHPFQALARVYQGHRAGQLRDSASKLERDQNRRLVEALSEGDTTGALTTLADSGTPEARRMIMAQLLAGTKPESFGQPMPVTGPGGQPQFARFGNRGGVQPVQGYTPYQPEKPQAPFGQSVEGRMWEYYQAGPQSPHYRAAVSYLSRPRMVQTPAGTMQVPAAVRPDGSLIEGASGAPTQPATAPGGPPAQPGIIPGTDPESVKTAEARVKKQQMFPKARDAVQSLEQQHGIVLEDIDRALQLVEDGFLTTGLGSVVWSKVPSTEAYNLARLLETVKANLGFDKLQQMRDASPTGGALGQVSEMENKLLQATSGNLDQAQSAEQLKHNLVRIRDIIRGSGARRRQAFQTDFADFLGDAAPDAPLPEGAGQGQNKWQFHETDEIKRFLGIP